MIVIWLEDMCDVVVGLLYVRKSITKIIDSNLGTRVRGVAARYSVE